jgi:putative polyketide hydroxylase
MAPMKGERHEQVPVVIAGAGPAGSAAAIALALQGVESLVVERRADPPTLPRATGITLRSMELIRSWGVEDEVLAGGVDADWQLWSCRTLAEAADGRAVHTGQPTRSQSALISPTAPACVPQDHLEPVLRRRIVELGSRVEHGTALVALDQTSDGVRATLRDATGATRTVSARYLIAADGASSDVRGALGIRMRGPGAVGRAVSALFRAPLWDLVGDLRYGIYDIDHPEGRGELLPAGPDDRWLYGLLLDRVPGPVDVTARGMARRIELAAGRRVRPDIERIGTFDFAAGLAERFRLGNVFLAGDAAHRVTPRGGIGMNMALQGGNDLGWKLGWVLRGWAGPDLLDSYEAERLPPAETIVRWSVEPDRTAPAAAGLHMDLGGRIPHVPLPAAGGWTSTVDMLGTGLTTFAREHDELPELEHGGPPVTVQRVGELGARALGMAPGGTLLVRPDGRPAVVQEPALLRSPQPG